MRKRKTSLPRKCNVPECENRKSENNSFHQFPKNIILQRKWIGLLGIDKSLDTVKVCSEHFLPHDFFPAGRHTRRRKLKPNVMPSQNLPVICGHRQIIATATKEASIVERRQKTATRKYISLYRSDCNAEDVRKETEMKIEASKNEIPPAKTEIIGETLVETDEEMVDETIRLAEVEDMTLDMQPVAQSVLGDMRVTPDGTHEISHNSDSEEVVDDKPHILPITIFTIVCNRKTQFVRNFTAAEFIKSNSQLYHFSGIKSFELLAKVGECVTKIETARKRRSKFGISVKDRILLTLMKLKMKMPFQCLAVLFQIRRATCKTYFHCTIPSLSEACPALIVNVTEGKLKTFKFQFSSNSS